MKHYDRHIFVCTNQSSGVGEQVGQELKYEIKRLKMKTALTFGPKVRCRAQLTGCFDQCKNCKNGPGAAVVVYPEGTWYGNVRPEDVPELAREHLQHGRVVPRLLIGE